MPGTTVDAAARLFAACLFRPATRQLLRVLVSPADRARPAWRDWTTGGDWSNPATPAGRLTRAFAPLLIEAIGRHDLPVPASVAMRLRAWRLAEQQRAAAYFDLIADVVNGLAACEISVRVAGGAATTLLAYPHPALRHCHDVDLQVPSEHIARAAQTLRTALRCQPAPARSRADAATVLTHPSGVPIVLRARDSFSHPAEAHALRHHVHTIPIVEALAYASGPPCPPVLGPRALRWVVDVMHLAARQPPPAWSGLDAQLTEPGRALTVAAALAVLEADTAAPQMIAPDARAAIERAAIATLPEDVARLLPSLAAAPRSVRALAALPATWSTRARVAVTMLVPPPAYFHAGGAPAGGDALARRHLQRIARRLRRAFASADANV